MEKRYLIHMNDPKDWLRHWEEGTQVVNDFILPRGPYEKDEMSDTIYCKDAVVPYHQHEKGYETFYIARGSVDCVLRGKHIVANAGDMLHIPPFTPHGFRFLEEGTIWRELFQEINMAQGIMNKNTVKGNYPAYMDDPEFMKMYRSSHKQLQRETPVPEEADRNQVHELRTPEFAFSRYQTDGVDLKLKVGKWETGGVKEIWNARVSKGVNVEYDYPHCHWELYYIVSGAVEFDIMGEVFTAENDCLVHIPPYHRHKIRVLEDSEIFDYGGEMNLMALLEDYRSLEKYQPEKLKDPEFMTAFQRKYECYVTKFYRES